MYGPIDPDFLHEFDPDYVLDDSDDVPDAEQEDTIGEHWDDPE